MTNCPRRFRSVGVVALACVAALLLAATVSRSDPRPERSTLRSAPKPAAGRTSTMCDAPPAVATTSTWIQAENAKPGTTAWQIDPAHDGGIEAFASRVSAVRGEQVRLFVSTTDATYHVEAYRVGWYGGAGGRLIWRSPELPGTAQSRPTIAKHTHMVEAHWKATATLTPNASWPPGDYLLKVVASRGTQHYVPLTLRDDTSTSAFLVQNAVTTWEAYNTWGGYSLYRGPDGRAASRGSEVSFDRPYNRLPIGNVGDEFLYLRYELMFVQFAERYGLDVSYSTDVDLDAHPDELLHHRALVVLGHDEYWSSTMRTAAETARSACVNLAFLGANAIYRRIRFDSSSIGVRRREINYRRAGDDPIMTTDPSQATVNWRDPPSSKPESALIGLEWECAPTTGDLVIFDDDWIMRDTGLKRGDRIAGAIGYEYDRYNAAAPPPGPVQIIAESPVTCGNRRSFSNMSYYTMSRGGAGVFATGTTAWVSTLSGLCPWWTCAPNDGAMRMTLNVLRVFGTEPAGRVHPSQSNVDRLARRPAFLEGQE